MLGHLRCARAAHRYAVGASALDLSCHRGHRIEAAIRVEEFPEAHPDAHARRPLDPEPRPASEVLSHVEDEDPGADLVHRDWFDAIGDSYGRHILCAERSERVRRIGHCHRGTPGTRVETGRIPARLCVPRVVLLAEVHAVASDGPRVMSPFLVGADRLPGAVLVGDFELRDESWATRDHVLADIDAAPHLHRQRVVPTVAEHRAHHVVARLQHRRNIVARVRHTLVEAGPCRIENVVGDLLAVEPEFVVAEPGRIQPSVSHRAAEFELAP